MTRSIVWFLLVLSLLFNVFFVFGYMQAKASSQLPNGDITEANRVTEFVGNELKLDDKQREVFSKLRREMRVFNESIALSDQELLNELEKETPDLSAIRQMVVEQTDLNNQRRVERSQRFNDFLQTLSPDQCRRLSDRVGRSRHGRDRFQRMLKMFDENNNGKLDEDEMVKAKAAHSTWREKWQTEREKRRTEMREQFDANGDGDIDEEEWGAMIIKRYDTNGNGELDSVEISSMRAIRENGSRQRRSRRKEDTGSNDN